MLRLPNALVFLSCLLGLLSSGCRDANSQNTVESIGRQVVEAIRTSDFAKLEAMMPSEEMFTQLAKEEALSEVEPAQAHVMMRDMMKDDLDDILSNAKTYQIELAKLSFGSIGPVTDNPESALPMKVAEMQVMYLGKPITITYSMFQIDGDVYYHGIFNASDVFRQ